MPVNKNPRVSMSHSLTEGAIHSARGDKLSEDRNGHEKPVVDIHDPRHIVAKNILVYCFSNAVQNYFSSEINNLLKSNRDLLIDKIRLAPLIQQYNALQCFAKQNIEKSTIQDIDFLVFLNSVLDDIKKNEHITDYGYLCIKKLVEYHIIVSTHITGQKIGGNNDLLIRQYHAWRDDVIKTIRIRSLTDLDDLLDKETKNYLNQLKISSDFDKKSSSVLQTPRSPLPSLPSPNFTLKAMASSPKLTTMALVCLFAGVGLGLAAGLGVFSIPHVTHVTAALGLSGVSLLASVFFTKQVFANDDSNDMEKHTGPVLAILR